MCGRTLAASGELNWLRNIHSGVHREQLSTNAWLHVIRTWHAIKRLMESTRRTTYGLHVQTLELDTGQIPAVSKSPPVSQSSNCIERRTLCQVVKVWLCNGSRRSARGEHQRGHPFAASQCIFHGLSCLVSRQALRQMQQYRYHKAETAWKPSAVLHRYSGTQSCRHRANDRAVIACAATQDTSGKITLGPAD